MSARRRSAFTRVELIVCLAMAGVVLALVAGALVRVRYEERVARSKDNLHRITLALIDYADQHDGVLPPGLDDNHFSALSKVLPQLGEGDLHRRIDFSKSIDDPANRDAHRTRVGIFVSPLDDAPTAGDDPTKASGPTNYFVNGLVFPSKRRLTYPASISDGTSQTVFVVETLRGGPTHNPDVRRQHVVLDEADKAENQVHWELARREGYDGGSMWSAELQARWDKVGAQQFEAGKGLATHRGASWMDGSPLQTVLLPGRGLNDPRPDAIGRIPERMEGVSGPRSLTNLVNFAMGDGSVYRRDASKMTDELWFNALTPDVPSWGSDW
jgi:type II secretory pathway pseudopilin PulG